MKIIRKRGVADGGAVRIRMNINRGMRMNIRMCLHIGMSTGTSISNNMNFG